MNPLHDETMVYAAETAELRWNPQDLAKITDFTLSHYNERAEDFWEGTRDHNVNQNITALLQCIEGEPPYTRIIPNPPRHRRSCRDSHRACR